jgi:cyclase
MPSAPFSRGLHEVGPNCWAWFEPPGSWGLSNSGLVRIGDEMLVIDTQNDVGRARAVRAAATDLGGPDSVTTVVNTHEDGDHWFGNMLFDGARIVATTAAADGMRTLRVDPRRLSEVGDEGTALRRWSRWRASIYDYEGWRPVYPTETFDGAQTLKIGDGAVELREVGPAHTGGDAIVHVPEAGVVYAGDILFHRSTPRPRRRRARPRPGRRHLGCPRDPQLPLPAARTREPVRRGRYAPGAGLPQLRPR